MAKISELRDMSSEQLRLLLKDTTDHLFRLRIQSQTEKLDTPSELKKNRLDRPDSDRAAAAGIEGGQRPRQTSLRAGVRTKSDQSG